MVPVQATDSIHYANLSFSQSRNGAWASIEAVNGKETLVSVVDSVTVPTSLQLPLSFSTIVTTLNVTSVQLLVLVPIKDSYCISFNLLTISILILSSYLV